MKYSKYASTTPAFSTKQILKKRYAESLSFQLPSIFKERNTKHCQNTVCQLVTIRPAVAPNVVAAWRSGGLPALATSHLTCCFSSTFQRGTPAIVPNRSLWAVAAFPLHFSIIGIFPVKFQCLFWRVSKPEAK
jgi:hypothetical protein